MAFKRTAPAVHFTPHAQSISIQQATTQHQKRMAQAQDILRLSVRKDDDYRHIEVHLTLTSLGLCIWLGIAFILLYEILCVYGILLFSRNRKRSKSELPTATNEDKQSQQQQPISPLISVPWGVATAYGIFYSFEIIFLYINDAWYQLLRTQLLFTAMDVVSWMWMILHLKYSLVSKSSLAASVCIAFKIHHLIFNLVLERGIDTLRHWLFLIEDVTTVLMAKSVFGVDVRGDKSFRTVMIVTGVFFWVALYWRAATRIT